MMPRRIRKAELTELPMMPPTVPKASNLSDTVAAVAATTIDVMMTTLGKHSQSGFEHNGDSTKTSDER